MSPLKILALFFIIFALVKLLVICARPEAWKSFIKKIYAKPAYTSIIALIAAAVILRYLLQELTMVQIFASMTFMMALMMVQFAALGNEVIELADKFLKDRNIIKKMWLSLSVWIVLMVWVLYEIFI